MSLNPLIFLLLAAAVLILLGLVLYWLLISTEGVYLGQRVVTWLYDITAHRYDAIKEYDDNAERLLVTGPVLSALQGIAQPKLLDVATGTGRVPHDLLQSKEFHGTIVALDDSRRMLQVAHDKLEPFNSHVTLLKHPSVPLPFPDETFDLVTCLEALEFFPSDEAAVQEMARVLRPDRFLFVTRRRGWEGRLFLHRYRSQEDMQAMLHRAGLSQVQFHSWQVNYELVTALKPGP